VSLTFVAAIGAQAQSTDTTAPDDPFAAHRWHAEFALHAALEAWNYNPSHEELYGLLEGVTYGLRDGLVLTARQRTYYVSQRANDTWILGLTGGLRARVYRRGRASAFLQFDLGVSDAAIAAPPRGTRFNYLWLGGGGVLVRLKPRVHLVTSLEVMHVSNAGLKGPDRNPDIETIGSTLGLLVAF
jgi:hypothetical protein